MTPHFPLTNTAGKGHAKPCCTLRSSIPPSIHHFHQGRAGWWPLNHPRAVTTLGRDPCPCSLQRQPRTKPPWVDGLGPTPAFWWIVKEKHKNQEKLRPGEAKKQEASKGALQK